MGLHRDGSLLHLGPFDTELRLRLWWHLCVLDSRAPEDHGFELTVDILNQGLRLPLNIDDDQIYPNMVQLPKESQRWTEMSFCLVQIESCRLLHPVLGTWEQGSTNPLREHATKRRLIRERAQHVLNKFDVAAESPPPLYRIAMQHFSTARMKMEFILQLREEIEEQERQQVDTPKSSFKLACDGLESSYLLLKGSLSGQHKWIFRTYTPWYALAYVLRCLSNKPWGPGTKQAWALIDEVFPDDFGLDYPSQGILSGLGGDSIWECLSLLRRQAMSLRDVRSLNDDSARLSHESNNSHNSQPNGFITCTEDPPIQRASYREFPDCDTAEHGPFADSNQNVQFSLGFPIPEMSFLPEWNAVINGSLNICPES